MADTTAPAKPSSGKFGFLTRKLGPQPTWAWMAEALGLALAYALYKQRKASAATSSTSTSGTTAASSNGAVPADQIPDVIIQGPFTTGPTTPTTTATTPPTSTTPPVQTTAPPPATRPTSITASGKDPGDINQIAKMYGLTEAQLIAANPALKTMKVTVNGKTVKLYGSGQPVPAGTVIKIPAA
jgi:hypothetical protein